MTAAQETEDATYNVDVIFNRQETIRLVLAGVLLGYLLCIWVRLFTAPPAHPPIQRHTVNHYHYKIPPPRKASDHG